MKEYIVFEELKKDLYARVEAFKEMYPPTVMKDTCKDMLESVLTLYAINSINDEVYIKATIKYDKTIRLVLDDDLNLKEIAS